MHIWGIQIHHKSAQPDAKASFWRKSTKKLPRGAGPAGRGDVATGLFSFSCAASYPTYFLSIFLSSARLVILSIYYLSSTFFVFPVFLSKVKSRLLAKQRARQIYKNLLLIHLFEFITAVTEVKRSGTTLMI